MPSSPDVAPDDLLGATAWFTALSRGAVDPLDVAARLEMSGVSDRTARSRYGHDDVFTLAATLDRADGVTVPRADGGRAGLDLAEALRRALLLVAGVVMAAAVLDPLELPQLAVGVVGASGWIGGQVVAAVAWARLGWGQGAAGLRKGGAMTLLVLLAVLPAPVLLAPGAPGLVTTSLTLGWVAYACAVSLLVCARRTHRALQVVLVGLLLVGAAVLADRAWSPSAVLTMAAVVAGAIVLLAAQHVRRSGGPAAPARADWRAAAPAGLQALLLATSLLLLVTTVPPGTTAALVVASVVGAAMADPSIVVLNTWLRSSAGRVYLITVAARRARRAAVLAAASTAIVSGAAAVLVVLVLRADGSDWSAAVVPAAAFTAVATTSAALTAFGVPWRAVLAAAATVVYAGAAVISSVVAAVLVFPLVLLAAVALLLQRVSDPRAVV